jgi:PAS domain S-box-containing protein
MGRVRLRGAPAFACSVLGVLAATLLRMAFDPFLGDSAPFAVYFAMAILIFVISDFGPAALELALGGAAGAYFFMEPRGSLSMTIRGKSLLLLYLAIGVAMLLLFRSFRRARGMSERRQAELREAEAAIRADRQLWRATLASIGEAVVTTDRAGRVTFLNGEAERLTGSTAAAAFGLPLAEVVSLSDPSGRPVGVDAPDQALRRGEVFGPSQVLELVADGVRNAVEVLVSPIRDEDTGEMMGAVVVLRDVGAAVRSARELGEANEAAEAANRAKDRFLAALGHELRTPLTPVLLGVSYLIDCGDAPPDLLPTFEMIRRNVEQEARLIDELLDVVQISRGTLSGSPHLVDAHALIRETVDACRRELEDAAIEPIIGLEAPLHHVEADPARFRQAIAHLLKNAAKFGGRGGRVGIRSRLEPHPEGGGGRLVVEVSDSGIGIDPSALATIFDSFGQTRPADSRRRGGLGLGLSISRAIVAGAGGTLEAASPGLGRGATFTIRLDALPSPAASASRTTPSADGVTPLRILVVEDDEPTRRAVANVVRTLGHQVTTADSVASAVAEIDAAIDLLISDIGLPDGTGHDVLLRFSSRHPVKAIALSGFGLDDDIALSLSNGFAEHLTKPIDVRTLEDAIRRAANSA